MTATEKRIDRGFRSLNTLDSVWDYSKELEAVKLLEKQAKRENRKNYKLNTRV